MAPKKKEDGPSKKTENKAKAKVVEDLTFGLKNKNKSAKVQQYVKQVSNTVMHGQTKVRLGIRVFFKRLQGGASALEAQKYK